MRYLNSDCLIHSSVFFMLIAVLSICSCGRADKAALPEEAESGFDSRLQPVEETAVRQLLDVAAPPIDLSIQLNGETGTLSWTSLMPGDYNLDGEVNGLDLFMLISRFREHVEDQPGNECIDGNGDGILTALDMFLIANNFGSRLRGYEVYEEPNSEGEFAGQPLNDTLLPYVGCGALVQFDVDITGDEQWFAVRSVDLNDDTRSEPSNPVAVNYSFETTWTGGRAYALATDSQGNMVVAGSCHRDGESGAGMVVSMTPYGSMNWARAWGGLSQTIASDIAYAPSGDVVAVGEGDSHSALATGAFVIRYNPEGELLWQRSLQLPDADHASSVAVTDDGTSIVAGRTHIATHHSSALLYAVSASGDLIWQRRWDGGLGYTEIQSVIADGNGNIYAGGGAKISGDLYGDLLLVRVMESGDEIWQKVCGGDGWERIEELRLLSDGTLLAFCATTSSNWNNRDHASMLVNFNSDGEILWAHTVGAEGYLRPDGLAVSANDDIFISGIHALDDYGSPFIARLDLAGGSSEGLIWSAPETYGTRLGAIELGAYGVVRWLSTVDYFEDGHWDDNVLESMEIDIMKITSKEVLEFADAEGILMDPGYEPTEAALQWGVPPLKKAPLVKRFRWGD